MRSRVLALVATACCGGGAPSSPGEATAGPGLRPVRGLRETARYARLAAPVAFASDGGRWIGADGRELVVFRGDAEERRYPVMVNGGDVTLAPLPRDGWIAGARILDADGQPRFDGHAWASRYGRFGSPKAVAFSDDGRVGLLYGADSPSTCLCDRDLGRSGGSSGALVRIVLAGERPTERVLKEYAGRAELEVAASSAWVAAIEGPTLSVWPAAGDGPPVIVQLVERGLRRLRWSGDRYLVGVRFLANDRDQVVVLDRLAGYAPAWTWVVDGSVRDLRLRPGTGELALAVTRYRATDRVEVDERRVQVVALDGTRRAAVATLGYPASIGWSPAGDQLLVATTGNKPAEQAVVRFQVR